MIVNKMSGKIMLKYSKSLPLLSPGSSGGVDRRGRWSCDPSFPSFPLPYSLRPFSFYGAFLSAQGRGSGRNCSSYSGPTSGEFALTCLETFNSDLL